MKKIPFLIISILFSAGLFAQGVYNNGAKIVIGTGVTLNLSGPGGWYRNVTNVTNGSMDLFGTLKIGGNIINNVATADFLGTTTSGEVMFTGTSLQILGGATTATYTFPNLTINNPSGIVIAKNSQVNGTMTFTSGLVDIGNNNFTFGPLSTVAGSPSASSMILATGIGQVMKIWPTIGAFTFPVGDNNLSATYSPVTLSFTSGTFAPGTFVGLNLVNARFGDPSITGSYINRYWNISQTGITSFLCNSFYDYPAADIVGTESNITSLQVLPIPITAFNPANTLLHQLSTTGLSSLGTFTGGPGNDAVSLSVFLEGPFNSTTAMNTTLNTGNLMPLNQPYSNVAPWNYTGTESVTTIPAGVVDWVLVEVRQATSPDLATSATILTKRAGFLKSDGAIVDLDGASPLNIGRPTITGNLYVVVRHRNHLAIMSSTSPTLTGTTYSYDFTTGLTQVYGGGTGYKQIGVAPLKFGMIAGDVDHDGQVITNDYNSWASKFGITGLYLTSDIDMNGQVFTNDYNKWAVNFSNSSNILLKSAQISRKYFSGVPK